MDVDKTSKPQEKTGSLLITVQNNTITTIYIKVKMNNALQKSNCVLCRVRDDIVNPMMKK